MDLDEVLKVLKARGLNLTPQRQEILRALLEGPPHQTAAEILQRVRRRFPSVSFDTVYRNLHLLQSLNLVSRTHFGDGDTRYELCAGPEHHHHALCLGCGKAVDAAFCPMPYFRGLPDEEFTVTGHSFKLFGYCGNCRRRREE